MTPEEITGWLDASRHRLAVPAVYEGGEANTYHWTAAEWTAAELRVCLLAAFDYKQGVGGSTLQLLYQLANEAGYPRRVVERCYFPSHRDDVRQFERSGVPLFGLETRHALGDYDVLAVSLAYLPYLASVVKAFSLSGIPVCWRDRRAGRDPLVLVGGQSYASPGVLWPVADLIWCGEAEDEPGNPGWTAVLAALAAARQSGALLTDDGREQMLRGLVAQFPFLLVPRFYEIEHGRGPDGLWRVTGWQKRYPELPDRVVKRYVRDLDSVPALTRPVIPYEAPGYDDAVVQVSRGCSFHCGFCAPTYREAPYRERSLSVVEAAMAEATASAGTVVATPLALEFGTFGQKKTLLADCGQNGISLRLPSMRVDNLAADPVFSQLSAQHERAATLAVEGMSQRLREVVSKGIDEESILRAVVHIIAAGYRQLKIYMICDLPGETAADSLECAELCRKIDDLRRSVGSRLRVRLSWKPLLLQSHTPLQWFPVRRRAVDLSEALGAIRALGFGVQISTGYTKATLNLFAQLAELADDVAGEALVEALVALDTGCYGTLPAGLRLLIETALAKRDRTAKDYFRAKDEDEVFLWDIVDTLVTKAYLLRHYRAAKRRAVSDPALRVYAPGFLERFGSCKTGCTVCGACDRPQLIEMRACAARTDPALVVRSPAAPRSRRVWAVVRIPPERRWILRAYWSRLLRRQAAGGPAAPALALIRWATDRLLSRSAHPWWSGLDVVEVMVPIGVTDAEVLAAMRTAWTPVGLEVLAVDAVERLPLAASVEALTWSLAVPLSYRTVVRRVGQAQVSEPVVRYTVRHYLAGQVRREARWGDVVRTISADRRGTETVLRCTLDARYSPYDVAAAVLGHSSSLRRAPAMVEQLALRDGRTIEDRSSDLALLPSPEAGGRQNGVNLPRPGGHWLDGAASTLAGAV